MINFKKLVSYQYLFQIDRLALSRFDKAVAFLAVALLLLAAVFKFASMSAPSPVDKKYRHRFYSLCLWLGLALAVWFGARYEGVMFFGTHFVAFAILLTGAVCSVWQAVKMFKNYSAEKSAWDKDQLKLKYLPK